jgi:ATP-dependent Zn protease
MIRKTPRLILAVLVSLALAAPAALLAQENAGRENPLITVLFTWAPVLLIVFLWWFFMRKAGFGVKGGYKQYMNQSLDNAEGINRNLERIATQLERLVAVMEKSEGGPRST